MLVLYYIAAKNQDVFAYGLGTVLLQQQKDQWSSLAFGSRLLTETKLWYAQIEKETLALTRALEYFSGTI